MALRGGIDLGGTKIQAIVVDDDQQVLGQARQPTPTSGGPQDVADAMAAALKAAAEAAKVEPAKLQGVGAGSPGIIDPVKGTVSSAKNLPDWAGTFALGDTLSKAFGGVPVKLGNDVGVATEAEFRLGVGREYTSLLGVFWGTGVGGGIVIDSQPWHGRGAAGEIGHVVVERDGRRCPCGRKGCMEAYAGRSAMEAHARRRVEKGDKTKLFKLMEEHDRPRLTSGIWARALEHEDELATELIDEALAALGVGVASVVNVLDPEAIVLGGGMGVRFGEQFAAERIREAMEPHLFTNANPAPLKVAALGDLGGALGAALLVS